VLLIFISLKLKTALTSGTIMRPNDFDLVP
jgi:hypothetical protein